MRPLGGGSHGKIRAMRGNPAESRFAPGIDQEIRNVPFSSRMDAFASGGAEPSPVSTRAVKPRKTTERSPSVNASAPSMRPRSPYATPAPYTISPASRRQRPADASVPDARAVFAAASAAALQAFQSASSGTFGCGPSFGLDTLRTGRGALGLLYMKIAIGCGASSFFAPTGVKRAWTG